MFFYLGLFTFCTIMLIFNNMLKKQQDKKKFEIITIIILCIISGTRYNLGGTDYYIYEVIFNAVPSLSNFNFATVQSIPGTFEAEKGFLFLCSAIKTIGFNFYGFTLIHSIIFYTLIYLGLKKYNKNFNLLIIVFLYKMFFYDTFISLRQTITIAIFFISLKYIEQKKIIPYLICCSLAVPFHNGAYILFLVYFINKYKLTKRKLIILNCIFIPTIILGIFHVPILAPFQGLINFLDTETAVNKAKSLVESSDTTGIGIFHTLEYFLLMFFIIKNYTKIIAKNEHAEFIIKLFLILLPIFTLFRGYAILTREKDYFLFTYAVILQYLCQIREKKYYNIVQIATVAVCLFGFCRFIILFDSGAMIPYQSYLNKDISITEKDKKI